MMRSSRPASLLLAKQSSETLDPLKTPTFDYFAPQRTISQDLMDFDDSQFLGIAEGDMFISNNNDDDLFGAFPSRRASQQVADGHDAVVGSLPCTATMPDAGTTYDTPLLPMPPQTIDLVPSTMESVHAFASVASTTPTSEGKQGRPVRAVRARPKRQSSDDEYVASIDDDISDGGDDFDGDNDDEGWGAHAGSSKASDFIEHADLNQPLTTIVDAREEQKLAQKLFALQQKLQTESKQLRALGSGDRKRKRNQLASQISRLRKKLLVFELQRRYIETCQENAELKAYIKKLEARAGAPE